MNTVYGPALHYLRVSLKARYARARSEDAERGASAVEWVVISAIVVLIVVTVGGWLLVTLENKGKQVCNDINTAGDAPTKTNTCGN